MPLHSAHCAYPSLGLGDSTANQVANIPPLHSSRRYKLDRPRFMIQKKELADYVPLHSATMYFHPDKTERIF